MMQLARMGDVVGSAVVRATDSRTHGELQGLQRAINAAARSLQSTVLVSEDGAIGPGTVTAFRSLVRVHPKVEEIARFHLPINEETTEIQITAQSMAEARVELALFLAREFGFKVDSKPTGFSPTGRASSSRVGVVVGGVALAVVGGVLWWRARR